MLAIVGESGSGKSVAMLAAMGLLPPTAAVTAERMAFDGVDLMSLSPDQRRRLAGKDMAMIFQEPMSSLNPCFTVGFQIGEALMAHLGLARKAREARVVELLAEVGIPDPARRARLSASIVRHYGGLINKPAVGLPESRRKVSKLLSPERGGTPGTLALEWRMRPTTQGPPENVRPASCR